jgi:hypothetical protein
VICPLLSYLAHSVEMIKIVEQNSLEND